MYILLDVVFVCSIAAALGMISFFALPQTFLFYGAVGSLPRLFNKTHIDLLVPAVFYLFQSKRKPLLNPALHS